MVFPRDFYFDFLTPVHVEDGLELFSESQVFKKSHLFLCDHSHANLIQASVKDGDEVLNKTFLVIVCLRCFHLSCLLTLLIAEFSYS